MTMTNQATHNIEATRKVLDALSRDSRVVDDPAKLASLLHSPDGQALVWNQQAIDLLKANLKIAANDALNGGRARMQQLRTAQPQAAPTPTRAWRGTFSSPPSTPFAVSAAG